MYKHFIKKIEIKIENDVQKYMKSNNIAFLSNCLIESAYEAKNYVKNWIINEDIDLTSSDSEPVDLTGDDHPAYKQLEDAKNEIINQFNSDPEMSKIRKEILKSIVYSIYKKLYMKITSTLANSTKMTENKYNLKSKNRTSMSAFLETKKFKHPFVSIVENVVNKNHNLDVYLNLLLKNLEKESFYESCLATLHEINKTKFADLYHESDKIRVEVPKVKINMLYLPNSKQFRIISNTFLDKITDERMKKVVAKELEHIHSSSDYGHDYSKGKKPTDYHKDLYNILKKVTSGSYLSKVFQHLVNVEPFTPELSDRLISIVKDNTVLSKEEQEYGMDLIKNYTKNL